MKKPLNFKPLLDEIASRPGGALVAKRLSNFLRDTTPAVAFSAVKEDELEQQKSQEDQMRLSLE